MELPEVVNGFDGHMEGRGKKSNVVNDCVKIINQVSQAEKNPKEGMNIFFQRMNAFFSASHEKYFKKSGKFTPSQAKRKVYEYEKAGTFFAANKNLTVRDDYINVMLGITSGKASPEILTKKYKEKQDEIYSSRSVICHVK